jgi:CheY-like chemotaxis protein
MLARFVKGDVRGLTHHKGVMGSDPLAGRKAYFSPTMVEEFLSLRVLVVDDELLIRWSIAETLTSAGHTVVEAENGAAAVQALTNSMDPFDAVFLDYRLPDSDGLKLLAAFPQKPCDSDDGVRFAGSDTGRIRTGRLSDHEQAVRTAGSPTAAHEGLQHVSKLIVTFLSRGRELVLRQRFFERTELVVGDGRHHPLPTQRQCQ